MTSNLKESFLAGDVAAMAKADLIEWGRGGHPNFHVAKGPKFSRC